VPLVTVPVMFCAAAKVVIAVAHSSDKINRLMLISPIFWVVSGHDFSPAERYAEDQGFSPREVDAAAAGGQLESCFGG
jgi:hypothetical protein